MAGGDTKRKRVLARARYDGGVTASILAEKKAAAKTGPKGPWKMTPEVVNKLCEAFAIGASDREACAYAEISHQALYNYQEKHPEFVERKESLKRRPLLVARQSVVKGMSTDPNLALRYLERRLPNEFALRRELTGADGKELPAPLLNIVAEEIKPIDPEQG